MLRSLKYLSSNRSLYSKLLFSTTTNSKTNSNSNSNSSTNTINTTNTATTSNANTTATSTAINDDIKLQILGTSLKYVNSHNWSQQSLLYGLKELNLSPSAIGLIERGEIELVEYYIKKCNKDVMIKLNNMDTSDLGITGKIALALKCRLEMQIPYLNNWSTAMALGALPSNLPNTLKHIGELMDDIWHFAGDKSTDINWYSKRLLAAGVYSSTEIYMLTDKSPNCIDSWRFLSDRLDNVATFGRLFGQFMKKVPKVNLEKEKVEEVNETQQQGGKL